MPRKWLNYLIFQRYNRKSNNYYVDLRERSKWLLFNVPANKFNYGFTSCSMFFIIYTISLFDCHAEQNKFILVQNFLICDWFASLCDYLYFRSRWPGFIVAQSTGQSAHFNPYCACILL